MRSLLKKLIITSVTFLIFLLGLLLGKINTNRHNIPNNFEPKQVSLISPSPLEIEDFSQGLSYTNLELRLRDEQNINSVQSELFAFKIVNFHPEWECFSLGYDNEGFKVSCKQKTCSISNNNLWPNKLSPDELKICLEELANREYPQSLNNILIKAVEYSSDNEIIDYSKILDQSKLQKTPSGIFYELNKINTSKYSNIYSALFYSPFELTDRLSKMGGTFHGADWIYGKYSIQAEVSGNDINDEKVISLFNRIIDSIVFIKPV